MIKLPPFYLLEEKNPLYEQHAIYKSDSTAWALQHLSRFVKSKKKSGFNYYANSFAEFIEIIFEDPGIIDLKMFYNIYVEDTSEHARLLLLNLPKNLTIIKI